MLFTVDAVAVAASAVAARVRVEIPSARLLTLSSTTSSLLEMPSARPLIKSGIQLSYSVKGPSSGTEKCRKDFIFSPIPFTASTMP